MQFRIEVRKDDALVSEVLSGWMLGYYKAKRNSVLKVIDSKLKRFKVYEDVDEVSVYVDESDDAEYLEKQKAEFEDFMFMDEEQFEKDNAAALEAFSNDRVTRMVMRKVKRFSWATKNKAIKAALGGSNALGFLARNGIGVTWEIR